jgi:hypothetical protein
MNKLHNIAVTAVIGLIVMTGLGIGAADAHCIRCGGGPGNGGNHHLGFGRDHRHDHGFYRNYAYAPFCWVTPYGTVRCGR